MTDPSDTTSRPDPSEPARAWVFGDNIDTDQITPSRFIVSSDPDELAEHAFEDLRPEFSETVEPGDFVVAGENFGSGSSREHSPLSLVGAGVSGVVAQSFARIFFRNAINLGLPVLICPGADAIDDGDEIHMDLDAGIVVNHTKDEQYDAEALPSFLQTLVERGGLKAYTKAKLDR
ncbi:MULTISPECIES: 3-isopropylmalate dehydratase small subunit [Haloferax]|uniref:3-isopropylmalate dehydratase small subunit n=2 Tax=Haloferax TaxID=2251 RepID=A0A6G1Z714_9EURY|nr:MULTISPECIES: 3-isopropylmalate dehydratase small subunit [Haloferax]KAB1185015.1 3-isopropylmalate dehydratase small subunit [Haloferax sp. CBA1149]MRW82191.1 3-isopropylmalate dehydratase [Haloferax marinisediminis]